MSEKERSLTSRQEGDLYWTKRKRLLESAGRKKKLQPVHDHFEKKLSVFGNGEGVGDRKKPVGSGEGISVSGRLISGFCSDEVVNHIPDHYMALVRRGEMTAAAVYSEEPDGSRSLYGVSVTAILSGWLEIVYLYIPEKNRTAEGIRDLLQYVICADRRRYGGSLSGVFTEIPAEEVFPELREALVMAGLEVREEKGNVYHFCLSDVTEKDAMLKAAAKASFCALKDADGKLLQSLEQLMQEDDRPVPAAAHVEWERYQGDVSMICLEGGKPAGVILILEEEGYPVLELVYTASKTALPKLIGGVLGPAEKRYKPTQEILVPIVAGNSREIVEKIVPEGRRSDTLMAVQWFEEAEGPKGEGSK